MTKRVLDVGNCGADHARLSGLIRQAFQAEVVRVHTASEALATLRTSHFDLVLVNRILDADGSDGLELIRSLKDAPDLAALPVMLITNYAEYQEQAVAAGAEAGFGKSALLAPETAQKLGRFLQS